MFSVGRESLSGLFVLAVVVNSGQDGVPASVVHERLEQVSVVDVSAEEVSEVLRALERQGFVRQSGLCFCATDDGSERVRAVASDLQMVIQSGGGMLDMESEII